MRKILHVSGTSRSRAARGRSGSRGLSARCLAALVTRPLALVTVAATFTLTAPAVRAQTYGWTAIGGGNWSNTAHWSGGVAPLATNTTHLLLNSPGDRTLNNDLADPFLLNALTLGPGQTLTGGGLNFQNNPNAAPRVTLMGNGVSAIGNNISYSQLNVSTELAGGTLNLTGTLSGGNLTKIGGGTLTLGNATHAITGDVNAEGTLRLNGGQMNGIATLVIGNSAAGTLDLNGGARMTTQNLYVGRNATSTGSPGIVNVSGAGTSLMVGRFAADGTTRTVGTLTMSGGSLNVTNGATLDHSGATNLGGGSLNVDGGTFLTGFAPGTDPFGIGLISGSSPLRISGGGTVRVFNGVELGGDIEMNGGTFQAARTSYGSDARFDTTFVRLVGGSNTIDLGTSRVSGGTLGTVTGTGDLNVSGSFALYAGSNHTGSLTVNPGAQLSIINSYHAARDVTINSGGRILANTSITPSSFTLADGVNITIGDNAIFQGSLRAGPSNTIHIGTGGTLLLRNTEFTSKLTGSGTLQVNSGTVLSGDWDLSRPFVSAGGTVTGNLSLRQSARLFSQGCTVNGTLDLKETTGATLTLGGLLRANGLAGGVGWTITTEGSHGTLDFGTDAEFFGTIASTGAGSLIKKGANRFTLPGGSHFARDWQVREGELALRGDANFTVNNSLILGDIAATGGASAGLRLTGTGTQLTTSSLKMESGTLHLSDGAKLHVRQVMTTADNPTLASANTLPQKWSDVTLTGAGTRLTTGEAGNGGGEFGLGRLRILDGAVYHTVSATAGGMRTRLPGDDLANLEVTVAGAGSRWDVDVNLNFSTNSLSNMEVRDGGVVAVASKFYMGSNNFNAHGLLNVTGANSLLSANDFVGMGETNVTSGGTIRTGTGGTFGNNLYLRATGGMALVDGAGSRWENEGIFEVGHHSSLGFVRSEQRGKLTVSNGGAFVNGGLLKTVTAGANADYQTGVLLNGGTLTAGSVEFAPNTYLEVRGNSFLNVGTDFNAGAYLRGDGTLNKGGAGVMTVNGPSAFTGTYVANGGTLRVVGGTHDANGFGAANGGTLELTGGATLNPGAANVLRANAGGTIRLENVTVNGGSLTGVGTHVIGPGTVLNGTALSGQDLRQGTDWRLPTNTTLRGKWSTEGHTLNWQEGLVTSAGGLTVGSGGVANLEAVEINGQLNVRRGGRLNHVTVPLVLGGGSRAAIGARADIIGNVSDKAVLDLGGHSLELNGGLLVNNGIIRNGLVNVNYGGTAKGAGSYLGGYSVNDGGRMIFGNSPGVLTSGSATWNVGALLTFEIDDAAGLSGVNWGRNDILGSLTLVGSRNAYTLSVLSLADGPNNLPGALANFDAGREYSWLFATASEGISGFDPCSFVFDMTGFRDYNSLNGGTFGMERRGDSLFVRFSPGAGQANAPEPASLVLAGLVALGVLSGRGRRAGR
jgi:fibronectin-binding autotransporter adhesin